jgi:hypothetical protein
MNVLSTPPNGTSATNAGAATPAARGRDAMTSARFSQTLQARERVHDEAAARRHADANTSNETRPSDTARAPSVPDAGASDADEARASSVDDDDHDARRDETSPAPTVLPVQAMAALEAAAAREPSAAGVLASTSATANAVDARRAADAALTGIGTADAARMFGRPDAVGAPGSAWTMALPDLGAWSVQAHTGVDGSWNLAFNGTPAASVLTASLAMQGHPTGLDASTPSAVTLASQVQVLAQRLQQSGVEVGRIDIADPNASTRDEAFERGGDDSGNPNDRERRKPRR